MSNIILNNLKYIGINKGEEFFKYSLRIPSAPGALLFFNFVIVSDISLSDITPLRMWSYKGFSHSSFMSIPSISSPVSKFVFVLIDPCHVFRLASQA